MRLTNTIRDRVRMDLLIRKFGPVIIELDEKAIAFSEKLYNELYDLPTQRKMKKLPKGWLAEASSISVSLASKYSNFYFESSENLIVYNFCRRGIPSILNDVIRKVYQNRTQTKTKNTKLFLAKDVNGVGLVLEASHPLSIEYEKITFAFEKLAEDIREANNQLIASLSVITTVKSLISAWPEVKHFVQKHIPTNDDRNLPALPIRELNAMFDLPVEEEKEAA